MSAHVLRVLLRSIDNWELMGSTHTEPVERMKAEEHFLETLAHEDLNSGGRVRNWRNYIPGDVVAIWKELPREAMVLAYLMAVSLAHNEEVEIPDAQSKPRSSSDV